MQLKDIVETLQSRPDFAETESFETLQRHWVVKGLSVRPTHRMVAHSGFTIVSRRLAASKLSANVELEAADEDAVEEEEPV